MRGVHPLWALLGVVLCIVLALVVAPVFPDPLDAILYWGGWIGALVFVVLGVIWLAAPGRRTL